MEGKLKSENLKIPKNKEKEREKKTKIKREKNLRESNFNS